MKSKALIPLVIGIGVGVFAIKYTMDAVRKAQGATSSSELITVVMAQKDIPATETITPDMIVAVKTPMTPMLPRDAFTDVAELEGRVALKSIPRGSPVLPSMIAPKGTPPGLTVRVKEGFRAVAVKIDESSGVGYLVHPGDWVDVLAVMETRKFGKVNTESKLILERVQVAAVGQALNEGPEEGANRNVQSVTLIVRVDDVPKLHLAQTRGRITLAMRGAEDMSMTMKDEEVDEIEALAAVQTQVQVSAAPEPEPAPPVVKTTTVTVVNNTSAANSRSTTQEYTFPDENSITPIGVGSGDGNRRNPLNRIPVSGGGADVKRGPSENVDEPVENQTERGE